MIERDPNYMRRVRSHMWLTRKRQKKTRRERNALASQRAAFKSESVLIRKDDARA
jgi:hypothetical protein